MSKTPLSQFQFQTLQIIHNTIEYFVEARNNLIAQIIRDTEYAGKDLKVDGFDETSLHFTLIGGDPSSSTEVLGEQLTLKLED